MREDPSKKFWKENNSKFHMMTIIQHISFAPCDGLSQITSHNYTDIPQRPSL